jgi:hypothetical protein
MWYENASATLKEKTQLTVNIQFLLPKTCRDLLGCLCFHFLALFWFGIRCLKSASFRLAARVSALNAINI